jgi:hypothetical protein
MYCQLLIIYKLDELLRAVCYSCYNNWYVFCCSRFQIDSAAQCALSEEWCGFRHITGAFYNGHLSLSVS